MIKILKGRALSKGMLPIAYPRLDDYNILGIQLTDGDEAAAKAFDRFIADHDNALAKNKENFERAGKWINQCAMWHGFTHFAHNTAIVQNIQHQDWCPAPYWYNFYESNRNN